MKEETHAGDLHLKEQTYGGVIHGGDMHMKEQTYGETYTWWSLHTVECINTHGRTTEGTYTRRG